jgi:aspartate/methionine/tyrosine aminotransferase
MSHGEACRARPPALSAAAAGVRQSVFAALQGRIDAFEARGGRLIPLQIGDTHLAPPPAALEAVAASSRRVEDVSLYGGIAGLTELREACAERVAARGLGPPGARADNVLVGCGCTHALFCAVRALLDPGDEVLVASPYWPLIVGLLRAAGAEPVEVPVSWRLYDAPALDVAAELARACTPRTRAVYVTTPNNPDGQVWTRAQLESVAAVARARDLWVLSDEVYADFVYEGEHVSLARLPDMAERTVCGYSLSKSHALAGARIGFVVGPERAIAAARRISNHTLYNVPVTMQRAALAAVRTGEPWLSEARARQEEARDATLAALAPLARRGVGARRPRGGSFVLLDLAEALAGRAPQALFERAIDEGVLLAPGDAFGAGFERFARLCFTGVPLPDVLEGVARLGRALEALG